MKRKLRWPRYLVQGIRDSYRKQFVWGEMDCVTWACSIINELVEEDVVPPVTWSTKAEAIALLKERSLKNRMIDALGEPNPMVKTMRGDFVYNIDPISGETLGVAAGDKVVFLSSKGGIITKDLLDCVCSWSID